MYEASHCLSSCLLDSALKHRHCGLWINTVYLHVFWTVLSSIGTVDEQQLMGILSSLTTCGWGKFVALVCHDTTATLGTIATALTDDAPTGTATPAAATVDDAAVEEHLKAALSQTSSNKSCSDLLQSGSF